MSLGVIYQADVRMRSERCHRILEQLIEKHGERADGKNKDRFDSSRPWDGVWRRMAEKERHWWFKHVDKPIMLVEAKIKAASSFVEGDAPHRHQGPCDHGGSIFIL